MAPRELLPIDAETFDTIQPKDMVGSPVFINYQGNGCFRVWPKPDDGGTDKLIYQTFFISP